MRLRTIISFLFLSLCLVLRAETVTLTGTLLDWQTLEPVPFGSVLLKGTDRGVLTDDMGRYTIQTALPFDSVMASAMGYETTTVKAPQRKGRMKLDIKLKPTGVLLGEVVAKPKKEHYSKKNNPAVEFMERIRNARDLANPRTKHPNYNYDKYERISLAINDFEHTPDTAGGKVDKMAFITQYLDTSALTGKTVLNISVREKASSVHHRLDPESEKEYVKGLRTSGMDEFLDRQSLQKVYEDVMREIDVYQNDITILQTRFVSPLSRIAPDFYKFYLTDTVQVDSVRCVELTFVPRNPASMGFTGRFYVPLGDSTMFIKRIVMRVPHDINLNFIDQMLITQEFEQAPDGTRLKISDELLMDASVMPGTPGLYARRRTAYTGHNFDPAPDPAIFDRGLAQVYAIDAYAKDDAFWDGNRTAPIAHGEANMDQMMAHLRANPVYYWGEKLVKTFASGYIATAGGDRSKFDIGPLTSTFSSNTVEGFRLRLGGMTTANLSKRWFGRGYAAYGFKDHKWKYRVEGEYSFRDKAYHSREFPVHSIRATHEYDMNMLGQDFITNNQDNMFMSLRRGEDIQMLYQRVTKLEYTLETEQNFSVVARLESAREEPTRWMTFKNGFGKEFSHYTTNSATVELRWAPGEKFYQMKSGRLPINFDAPVFTLSHTWAPKGLLNNQFAVSTTEFSFSKRFWLSAYGSIDALVKGGHTWTQSPYPNLLIPNANLSYFIQVESFSMMDPMEFINDSYLQWDFTYWANGALLNNIPLLKKLKLREALLFRGLWGHLSKKNRPWLNPGLYAFPEDAHTQLMTSTPYLEAGVGLDNVLKVLRIDYVWRLTYRDAPNATKHGVRFMVHFSF